MMFNGGKSWGGRLEVYPLRTTKGRLLIGVTNEAGKEYGITVSRWINERRAGTITADFDRAYPSSSPISRRAELRMLADMEGGGK